MCWRIQKSRSINKVDEHTLGYHISMADSRWCRTMWVFVVVLISVEWTTCENSTTQSPPSKITCLACESAKSWDECDKNSKEKACSSNYNMCSNIYNKGEKVESFSRACSNTGTCQLLQEACAKLVKGKQLQCEVKCCHGDKCNAPVPPLHCYACKSHASWEDCDLNRGKVRCSPEEDTCGKIYASTQITGPYAKKCMAKAACTKLKDSCGEANKREVSGDECDVSCCQGDLCNAASLRLASGFLVIGLCVAILNLFSN